MLRGLQRVCAGRAGEQGAWVQGCAALQRNIGGQANDCQRVCVLNVPPPIIHSPGRRCYCRHPLLATLDLKHSPAPRLTIIHNPALSSSCRHRCFSLSYKISKYFLVCRNTMLV